MSATRPPGPSPASPTHVQHQNPSPSSAPGSPADLASSPERPFANTSSPSNLSPLSSPVRPSNEPANDATHAVDGPASPSNSTPAQNVDLVALSVDSSAVEGQNATNASVSVTTSSASPMEVVEEEIGAGLELDANEEYMNEDYMQDLRRVKVYELAGQNWRDLGTAFCSGEFDETIREAQLIAKSEETQEILLQITVRADDVYQRQADTLIVWTEPSGQDYALSFQDVEGCTEVWEFIMEVRRHLRSAPGEEMDPSSSFHDPPQTMQPIRLPEPTLANLGDIERQIRAVHRLGQIRERVAENVVSMDLVRKLVALMGDAEDLQSLTELHALFTLMHAILLLNDQGVYEHILRDDIFVDMVGLMEYDPDFPRLKANYRDFLRENAKHHQVIEFRDQAIQTKVHQTYRLLYLKDVVLARVLDDPMFNILTSLIIFNQIDIITYIQSEEYFLREIFSIFLQHSRPAASSTEVATTKEEDAREQALKEDKRAPALLLLHQFCSMGKNVQLPMRISLFRSLVDRGILYPVQWALTQSDIKVLNTAGEIMAMVLDHDAGGVRGYILRQVEENARREGTVTISQQQHQASSILGGLVGVLASTLSSQPAPQSQEPASSGGPQPTLLMMMCSILTSPEHEISLKTQLAESFKTLMDVPGLEGNLPGLKLLQPALRKDEQSDRFLEYFYTNCAEDLYKPILTNVPEHKTVQSYPLELTRAQSDLYLYLCDLLSGFLLQHSYQSHFFVTTKNLATRIASLLYVREKHLRLAALRFFRTCLRLNNNSVLLHLTRNDVFSPILELTKRESSRDNLLSSCCQEFFEHLRRENVKDVINHIMTTREPLVRQLATSPVVGERFRGLIQRWEVNNEPPPKVEIKPTIPPKRWGTRAVDAEDAYFNADEEESGPTARQTRGQGRKRGMPTGVASNTPNRRTQRPTGVAIPRAYPMALVDYQEEDEPNEPPVAINLSTASGKPSEQHAARSRSRTRRQDLARAPSSPNLDPNAPGPGATAASPTASTSAASPGDQPMNLLSQRRNAMTEIGPVAMDEDDDLIGPPISLSHKRRRDSEEEDETLERLAKRPALGNAQDKAESSSSSSTATAAGAAPSTNGSGPTTSTSTAMETENATAAAAAEPARSGKRPVRVKLSNSLLSTPPPDVKVSDKG